ncbi:hypothetical protein F5887DRAFT_912732 [Amanita rubescens]|nr:hypothetical protein F5887DRAFT_912732 [Amanita rubescens]
MHLYLTKCSHLNSSYVDDDGQLLYKVETPFKFFGPVSTITSALSGDISSASKISSPPPYDVIDGNGVKGQEHAKLSDQLAHLAEIKFNTISSSVMSYDGKVYETSQFFSKKGWRRDRVFTGPDSLEYQWILGCRFPELVRRDAARTPVARFHRRCLGFFGKARRASLEIFPEGMHMVDLILVTFVYIQKIRNDAERRRL